MGYTHYFSRTVSLSEEQAAQLCENAAKIVTYWFDHTRNSAEILQRKRNIQADGMNFWIVLITY